MRNPNGLQPGHAPDIVVADSIIGAPRMNPATIDLDVDRIAALFKEWEHHKVEGILTYRNRSYPSVLTGTMAPVHHTPWIDALDDSMATFLQAAVEEVAP